MFVGLQGKHDRGHNPCRKPLQKIPFKILIENKKM